MNTDTTEVPAVTEVNAETTNATQPVLSMAQVAMYVEIVRRERHTMFRRLCFASAYNHSHKAKTKRAGR